MGQTLKNCAPGAEAPNSVLGDPLVFYLEYVIDEVSERNELSGHYLKLAVEALRKNASKQ